MDKKRESRQRRARKSRSKMRELGYARLTVFKSNQHMYAQIIETAAEGDRVVASASTKQKSTGDIRKNLEGAIAIGRSIAEQAKSKGIEKVAFDRSGYHYHGKVKKIAEVAREAGLRF